MPAVLAAPVAPFDPDVGAGPSAASVVACGIAAGVAEGPGGESGAGPEVAPGAAASSVGSAWVVAAVRLAARVRVIARTQVRAAFVTGLKGGKACWSAKGLVFCARQGSPRWGGLGWAERVKSHIPGDAAIWHGASGSVDRYRLGEIWGSQYG